MPGKADLESILSTYSTGITAKLITPTRQDEEHIRGIADFPDLQEGEGNQDRLAEATGGSRFNRKRPIRIITDYTNYVPRDTRIALVSGGTEVQPLPFQRILPSDMMMS